MKFTERRQQPRYPVAVGFLEIADRTLKVDNVSEDGVGFHTDEALPLPEGERHQAFLILQHRHDQFEIPVDFEVRRREDDYVGARLTYQDEQHQQTVLDFIAASGDGA
jgi:hypothetical protein